MKRIVKKVCILTFLSLFPSLLLFAGGSSEISFSEEDTDTEIAMVYSSLNPTSGEYQAGIRRTLYGGYLGGSQFGALDSVVTASTGSSSQANERILTHENGTSSLTYNLYKDQEKTQILKDSLSDQGLLEYTFEPIYVQRGQTQNQFGYLPFYLEVDADQFAPAGYYTDQVILSLYEVGETRSSDTIPVDVEVFVEQFVGLNIGEQTVYDPNSQGAHNMNFETIESYESRSANAVALANTPYTIKASSTYDGRMRHESLEEYIPYQFSFSQSIIDLSDSQSVPVTVTESTQITPSTGEVYAIEVTIGMFEWKPAGDYHDNISFEIIAN